MSAVRRAPVMDLLTRLSLLLPPDRAAGVARLLTDDRSRRPSSAVRDTGAHQRLARLAAQLPPAADVVADAELLAALGEATALADPSLYQTFLSHYILCVGSITLLGGAAEDLADGLAHARTKGSFMVTEIGDAASHLRIRTEARFDPRRRTFALCTPDDRAAKFSSVAATGLPQQAVVCARLLTADGDGGVFSFLTDITGADGRTVPGVSVSGPVAIDALPLPYGFVRFESVDIPYDRWLADGASIDAAGVLHDPRGGSDARLQRTLGCGQALWATLPSAMAGLAGRSAAMAWRFSANRRSHGRLAPGRPVLDYSTQRHAVIGALASAFTLRCGARTALSEWEALRDREQPDGPGGAMTFAPWAAVDRALALRKVFSTRAVATMIDSLQHRCGVSGFFADNRLSDYLGLARAFDNAGGDNTLILLDTGRALAEEYAGSGRRRHASPADLPAPTDTGWWPTVVAALQDRLACDLALSWSLRHRAGLRDLELWNPLLEDALQTGEVHACRLAADAASASVTGGAPSWAVPGAADLAALDGLCQARRLSGPLLASGVLTPADVRSLPEAVDTLCDRLSPTLADIAAALDPGAPIARGGLDEGDYAAGLLARPRADGSVRLGRTP
ncbi:hypothetical protein ACFWIQ_32545 [Kitasatospora sp. NPDC127059]|uniref:acyl-CoA dehydrogenase family protein n=1 Tax=unclassified Kitasatospora TaxID=2633591 RepID=UPI00366839DE